MRVVLASLLSILSIQLSCAVDVESVNGKLKSAVIEALNNNKLNSAQLGIKVIDAKKGEDILDFDSDKNIMPASNTKLLTAAGALLSLGKDYRYKTTLYYDHKKSQTDINNLYIDFSGDPSLSSNDLFDLLVSLQKQGIHTISGNIYLVNTVFQGRDYPINQSQSDSVFGYGAPSSAYNLNENQVILNLKVEDHTFKPKQISGEKTAYENKLLAADAKMLKTCQFDASMDDSNTLNLAGCLPRNDYTFKFAIASPELMMKKVLRRLLTESGLNLKGDIQITTVREPNLKELTRHTSATLSVLIKHMLQTSDNLYAQSLLRTMGDKLFHVGSLVSGKNALIKVLQEDLGLNCDNIQLEDGAGMSQNDLLNANFLVELLYKIKLQKDFEAFKQGLPVYGKSGSLALRTQKELIGNIIAKTGTGTTSVTLSGYLTAKDGKTYIFSILLGNLLASQKALASKLQDQILLALYQE